MRRENAPDADAKTDQGADALTPHAEPAPPPKKSAELAPESAAAQKMRSAITAAARSVFANKGYRGAKVSEIAAACGVSPGNLYNYFPGKEAIGLSVVGTYIAELQAQIDALTARPPVSAEEHLRAYIRLKVDFVVGRLRCEPQLVELAEMVTEGPEGEALIEREIARQTTDLESIIARGAAAGDFALENAREAAVAVYLATRYFQSPFAISRFGLDTAEQDLERTLNLVCAGLRARSR
ncbi:MAG: TetR/AcrR family transcriptional regulator [Neomegalonema sp.]|nr:TetR/AcrR family transcriptional regulator [Neomegalonema sp.]